MTSASLQQASPRSLAGASAVAVLHLILIYGLINGLAVHRSPSPPRSQPITPDAPAPRPVETHADPYHPRAINPLTPHIPDPEFDPTAKSETREDIARKTTESTGEPLDPGDRSESAGFPSRIVDQATPTAAFGACTNAREVGASLNYPPRALREGRRAGHANVVFDVDPAGFVTIVGVSASAGAFEESARNAALQLRCAPGRYRMPLDFKVAE